MALATATSIEKLSRVFTEQQAVVIAETFVELHNDVVKIKDFSELKEIVQRIALTQEQTDHRIERLAQAQEETNHRIERLAQAQEETNHRIERLAQAQEGTEQRVAALETATARLVQAQEQTNQQIARLSQAQEGIEQRVTNLETSVAELTEAIKELTQVQQKTELSLLALIDDHKVTRKELGGLAMTVGYTLENVAYIHLPRLLQEQHGIVVQDKLTRTFVTDSRGNDLEVNIYGHALRDGAPVTIIGESKSQLSAKKVDEFFRTRVERFREVFPAVVPILVTHMISNKEVDAYARSRGCLLFYSYDLH